MHTVVLLSGGMDSSTLLAEVLAGNIPRDEVMALGVHYKQRHVKELASASMVARHYKVEYREADMTDLGRFLRGSSQTDRTVAVPHGHYADENMKVTVVPNRNMMLISVAAAVAIGGGYKWVAYAAHAGDHAIYPDCRPEFVNAMKEALRLSDWNPVQLFTPYLYKSKADIAKRAADLGVPLELTWSCYEGGAKHCGRCGTCVERREAFQLAGVPDPTEYFP